MATDQEPFDGSDELPRWRRTVPLALAALLAIALGLIIFLADSAAEQRDRAIARQRHSFEVMLLASQLEGTVANAEALLARYVVSLDRGTGTQYQDEWRNAQAELAALERATRDNERQRDNLADLHRAITDRGKTLTDLALRTTYKQKENLLGRLYIAGKSPDIARIRDALRRTIEQEKAVLAERNMAVDLSEVRVSRFKDSYATIGLGLLAAGLLALWFGYGAFSERRFARQLAEAEFVRADGLEAAVRERTAELEAANAHLRLEMEERARAEQSLRHLQKMEAIGKLTGGIEIARRTLSRDLGKARRQLDNAMEGAARAAALTERLLAFARPEPPQADLIDPDALILGMGDLIARATNAGISIDLDLQGGDWTLWVEKTQLENALLNLAINARDAMEGRGSLKITTRRLTLEEGTIGHCTAGDYIAITVADTGCGMTPDVIERAFEPFYTTKPVGKGTGLGLSQIFSFVHQAGGEITVDSTPGVGTTIRLVLPRAESVPVDSALSWPPAAVPGSPSELQQSASGWNEPVTDRRSGGRRILVVEDDARVLRATLAALKEIGYRGIACDHPGKAAALLAQHPDVALILTDVMMPDMTGPEMVAALDEAAARPPVIFVTGYADEGESTTNLADTPVLHKPFTLAQLAQVIGETLRRVEADAAAPVQ